MGELDIKRQAPNVARMKMLGAKVIPALSGSKTLKDATNEAIRDWINNPIDTHYIIGSVVGPHPYPLMVRDFQSVIGNEIKKQAFRPLMPGVDFISLNDLEGLQKINNDTAAVILETVQGDAGVRIPKQAYLNALKNRCVEVGALLIFDEIQCGMGRTGRFFAFEHFNIVPDILTLGKALGGGMPIGVMVSSCLLYTSPSPRDRTRSRMPSSA